MKKIIEKLFPNTYQKIISDGFAQGKFAGRARLRKEIADELEAFGVDKFKNDEMTLGFNLARDTVKKV